MRKVITICNSNAHNKLPNVYLMWISGKLFFVIGRTTYEESWIKFSNLRYMYKENCL